MRAMLRFLMTVTGLCLIGAAVAVLFFAGPLQELARRQAEERLTRIYGSPVRIESLRVHPLQGNLELVGFAVQNPQRFKEGEALRCARVVIDADPLTLLSAAPRIRSVRAEETELNLRYELGQGTNVGVLLRAASRDARSREESPEGTAAGSRLRRRAVVEEFTSTGGRVRLTSNLLPGANAALDLAPFSVDLAGERVSPAKLAAICLRSLVVETVGFGGMLRPVAELLREELGGA